VLRQGRFRLRGQDRNGIRYEAAARASGPVGHDGDREAAVHEGQRPAAGARALGPSRNDRAGRLHRMDGARQAASPALARHSYGQVAATCHQRNIVITHPEKVLFPEDGITQGELASYYERIAPLMVPHMRARPVSMERYPAGIGKKGVFQKDVSKAFTTWLERVEVPKKDGTVHHPIVTDTRSLLWLANQNCITPHVWTSRVPDLAHPD